MPGMTLQPGTDLHLTIAPDRRRPEPEVEDYIHDISRRYGWTHDQHVLIAPDGRRLVAFHVDALFDNDPIQVPAGERYPDHLVLIGTRQLPPGEYLVRVVDA